MKNKKFRIISFGLIFILMVGLYKSDFIMFRVIDYLDYKTGSSLYLGKIRNLIMSAVDDVNPLKGSVWKENDGLPVLNFDLSRKQFGEIALTIDKAKNTAPYDLYMPNELNQYLKTNITVNGKGYKGKIKLHGTNNPHFIGPKKSYSVKISDSKNESFPYKMRRFALVIPSQSNLIGAFTYDIADLLGMLTPQNFLVRMHINGIDQGVYHLEEKLDKPLLERNDLSGYDVVRSDDSWAHQYANNHGTMFSFDYSGLQDKSISGKSLNQIVLIKKILNSTDINFINQHVNVDKFILYDVLRYIFGDSAHMTSHDNIKLLYNTSNGRIEPYFRIENHIQKIVSNKLTYSPEQHVNIGKYTVNNLLLQLTKDDRYREKRNRKIYEVLNKKGDILKIFDELRSRELKFLTNDTSNEIPSRYFRYEMNQARKSLIYNFKFLETYLNYSRVFVELVRKDKLSHEISIMPDSNSPLSAASFIVKVDKSYVGRTVTFENMKTRERSVLDVVFDSDNNAVIDLTAILKEIPFSLSLDVDLEPSKKLYNFRLLFDGEIIGSDIEFYNDLSKQVILARDMYSIIVDESDVLGSQIPSFVKKLRENYYHIPAGTNITLNEDIILPYGVNLQIDEGVTIKLKQGVTFLVNGSLLINGSKERAVKIQNNDGDQKFGSLAVLGDGKSEVRIQFLEIYGGSEDVLNGVHLSGALSIHNHKFVSIENSDIHHNSADDGVNIKNAEFLVKNNRFHANKADQIDIDFGIGIVVDNHFSQTSLLNESSEIEISEDDNGDGLDFSGSQVVISGNIFTGFLDKGMSIGENTKAFVTDNLLEGNRSGITAKDQSQVYVFNNHYLNNEIDIEMYQKKKIFDHPSVFNLTKEPSVLKVSKTENSTYFKADASELDHEFQYDLSIFSSLEGIVWTEYE
ncbi:CotH kinase family protein [Pseudomonadales bacterium]|nr:CotH kinase family protein [Pseudomonadales bacterium]